MLCEYTFYLKTYAATRTGQCIPEAQTKRDALAVALGVRDAKDGHLCDEVSFHANLKQKLA